MNQAQRRLGALPPKLFWAFGAVFAVALWRFTVAEPVSEVTLPRQQIPPDGESFNLVNYQYGLTLRASSADYAKSHHLAFITDQSKHPSRVEKWMPAPGDEDPWIDLIWGDARTVESLILHFPAIYEVNQPAPSNFDIICLPYESHRSPTLALSISHNDLPMPSYHVRCVDARGIQLSFHSPPPERPEVIGLYEVEVFGQ